MAADHRPWHKGISRYQWLVLLIASLGWVFDIFEGQIFVASMRESMPDLLDVYPDHPDVYKWSDRAFGFFLLGGAFGGVIFGMISDRIGRSRTLIYTILFYSVFTCLSAFSQEAWQLAALRFLVAMGVGGEWAVASAMVAEVMPNRSRAVTSSIFHASSVFGTLLAVGAMAILWSGTLTGFLDQWNIKQWQAGFMIGILPALLTLWIRWKLKEPESWAAAKKRSEADSTQAVGRISELFSKDNRRNTAIGVTLATVGLVTFWGGHIYGKDALLRKEQAQILKQEHLPASMLDNKMNPDEWHLLVDRHKNFVQKIILTAAVVPDVGLTLTKRQKRLLSGGLARAREYKMAMMSVDKKEREGAHKKVHNWLKQSYFLEHKKRLKNEEHIAMALNTIGAGLGLVLFGWISNQLGRRGAFVFYHVGAFIMMLVLFKGLLANDASRSALMGCLPIFGFFTVGMHAGYAVYFPELYPTRLRGTGTGFCFNMGRLGTAAAFFGFAAMASPPTPETKAIWLAPLFLIGVVVVLFAKETRGEDLPE